MVFLYALEILLQAVFVVLLLTQVAWPLATKRPLLPMRRWWRRTKALADAQDAVDAAAATREYETLRRKAARMSSGSDGEERR